MLLKAGEASVLKARREIIWVRADLTDVHGTNTAFPNKSSKRRSVKFYRIRIKLAPKTAYQVCPKGHPSGGVWAWLSRRVL